MGQRARADAPMIRVILSGHQGQWVVGGPHQRLPLTVRVPLGVLLYSVGQSLA